MPSSNDKITTLLTICRQASPTELALVEMLIKDLGANTTAPYSAKPILAVIINNFAKYSIQNTSLLPRYIDIFLKHGFDCQKYGAACLQALNESVLDEQLLIAAQLLLDHEIAMPSAVYQNLLRTVSFTSAYHDYKTQNYYLSNLYFAYRQILINHFSPANIHFTDIAHYTCACEQPIINIMLNKYEKHPKHLYITLPDGILVIQNHPNIYLCSAIESLPHQTPPFVLSIQKELTAATTTKHIRSITFTAPASSPDPASFPHPDIKLILDNDILRISHQQSQAKLEVFLNDRKIL